MRHHSYYKTKPENGTAVKCRNSTAHREENELTVANQQKKSIFTRFQYSTKMTELKAMGKESAVDEIR